MSRGAGRCQRAVLDRLKISEAGAMNLDELVKALEARGFLAQNILRAVRALRRVYVVGVSERGPGRAQTIVSLPQPIEPLSNEELGRILAELPS